MNDFLYPREETETQTDRQTCAITTDFLYPREETETCVAQAVHYQYAIFFIPARGRKTLSPSLLPA